MTTGLRITNTTYWLALTAWVSVIVSAGVAATGVFTTLPDLGLTLEGYQFATTVESGRLAAGKVMDPIFAFVDIVQVVAAVLVLVTLSAQLLLGAGPLRRPSNLVRTFCVAVAVALLAARLVFIAPGMNRDLRAYWSAAEAGEMESAERHRAAFDARHPTAARMFNTTLILLLVCVGSSAVALGPARRTSGPELEEPQLLRQR
ncbi:MAG: hypothetical protein ACYTGG_08600 [Planctomycetota bacterium]|jgi:hypothetical protein